MNQIVAPLDKPSKPKKSLFSKIAILVALTFIATPFVYEITMEKIKTYNESAENSKFIGDWQGFMPDKTSNSIIMVEFKIDNIGFFKFSWGNKKGTGMIKFIKPDEAEFKFYPDSDDILPLVTNLPDLRYRATPSYSPMSSCSPTLIIKNNTIPFPYNIKIDNSHSPSTFTHDTLLLHKTHGN